MAIQVDPEQMRQDGYIILRDVVPAGMLEPIRATFETLVDRQRAIWARERKPDDPPGGVWETSAQPRLFYDKIVDPGTSAAVDLLLHENTLGVARQLMRGEDVGLHALFMMCSPVRDRGPASWHRDTGPDADAPLEGLHVDMTANGPGYVQWNLPLYDDDVLWVVPGSHRRRNTPAEERQLAEDPRKPLPGGVPVELRAGDAVVYTNFIMHWGSDYSVRHRRTVHFGHQSFGGPLWRYFHLWWDPGIYERLTPANAAHFRRWAGHIAREHDVIERAFRAILSRDGDRFRAALAELHPGEVGRATTVVLLCKLAQRLHPLTRPEAIGQPDEARAKAAGLHTYTLHLYDDVARRFTPDELDRIWRSFGPLDAALQSDQPQQTVGTQAKSTRYRVYDMPAGFDVDRFIASWRD